MRNWAWLLPCWVWKYFFAQLPRERVLLDGRTRFLIRLDEEFALVYDPARKSNAAYHIQVNENTPSRSPPEFSYLRKTELFVQPDVEEASSCEPVAYGMVSGLARKVIKAAR